MVHALNPFEALRLLDRLDEEGRRPAAVDLEQPDDPEDAFALEELFAERHPGVKIRWRRAGRFSRLRARRRDDP
jgi:hypothetical protein